jgi:hypothetical protein
VVVRGHDAFETLETRYADDPRLLQLYRRKLLKPGWPGRKDNTEREYIRRVKAGRRHRALVVAMGCK